MHDMGTEVGQILRDHKWTSILLVTSPYHERRAALVRHKLAPVVRVIAVPRSQTQYHEHVCGAAFNQVSGILFDYPAIFAYWHRGWI